MRQPDFENWSHYFCSEDKYTGLWNVYVSHSDPDAGTELLISNQLQAAAQRYVENLEAAQRKMVYGE
jgi:hypothetical protein